MAGIGLQHFSDRNLEMLYRHWYFHQSTGRLIVLLCIFTGALLIVATSHLFTPDIALILSTCSAAIALGLNIVLNVQSAKSHHITVALVVTWMCLSALCFMPIGEFHMLLPTIIISFALYTVFPFKFCCTVAISSILSLAQLLTFLIFSSEQETALMTNSRYSLPLLTSSIFHIWANFIGIYLFFVRNRLSRTMFLNIRNLFNMSKELDDEISKMESLLSAVLPVHIIESILSQMENDTPKVFVEHHAQISAVCARIYGLHAVLQQINVQEAGRLLNDLDRRIWILANFHQMTVIQSDAIVAIAGISGAQNDHAISACKFAQDLLSIVLSLSAALNVDISIRVGIGTGPISTGIIGAHKWHYEAIGLPIDVATELERTAPYNSIIIAEDTRLLIGNGIPVERVDLASWKIFDPNVCRAAFLLYPTNRRFSLVTLPQTINHVLQQSMFVTSKLLEFCSPKVRQIGSILPLQKTSSFYSTATISSSRRNKRKELLLVNDDRAICEKLQYEDDPFATQPLKKLHISPLPPAMRRFNQNFKDPLMEAGFHLQTDRWLVPALLIVILAIVIYGIYQVLAMPPFLLSLGFLITALALVLIFMLIIHLNYYENFCDFVARTKIGHSIGICLIIAILYTCFAVSIFSCPSKFDSSSLCTSIHFSAVLCSIWMLSIVTFVRFSSFYLLVALLIGFGVYAIHMFGTHSDLYLISSSTYGWNVQVELVIELLVLAILIYLQSRENERLIRCDYASLLKLFESNGRLDGINFLYKQVLLNSLPSHIVHSFITQSSQAQNESYSHFHPSVGILIAKLGKIGDWNGEFGFDRLNRIIYEIDQLLTETSRGCLEKVRSAHSVYIAAVGILPETATNVNDTPLIIGDQLAILANFGLAIKELVNGEGLDITIGIDLGPTMSFVIGNERPRYEIVGAPYLRAFRLMEAAGNIPISRGDKTTKDTSSGAILVSEDILLALRLRSNFDFCEKNVICVGPGLNGYLLNHRHAKITLNQQILSSTSSEQSTLKCPASTTLLLGNNTDEFESLSNKLEQNPFVNVQDNIQRNVCEPNISPGSVSSAAYAEPLPAFGKKIKSDPNLAQFVHTNDARNLRHKKNNPLEMMLRSMNSSLSSDIYSIDLNIETDESELEWITPEMIANNETNQYTRTKKFDKSPVIKGRPVAKMSHNSINKFLYSSECTSQNSPVRQLIKRKKKLHNGNKINLPPCPRSRNERLRLLSKNASGRRLMSGNASMSSEISFNSMSALDRLNSASRQIEKMIGELTHLNPHPPDCIRYPFPPCDDSNVLATLRRSVQSLANRKGGERVFLYDNGDGSCQNTDYDNAESIDAMSEHSSDYGVILPNSSTYSMNGHKRPFVFPNKGRRLNQTRKLPFTPDRRYDADDSNSSLASSIALDKIRWKSTHSIGYEDEYELRNSTAGNCNKSDDQISAYSLLCETSADIEGNRGAVGYNANFASIDADSDSEHEKDRNDTRLKVKKVSQAIQQNFGTFELKRFSDEGM